MSETLSHRQRCVCGGEDRGAIFNCSQQKNVPFKEKIISTLKTTTTTTLNTVSILALKSSHNNKFLFHLTYLTNATEHNDQLTRIEMVPSDTSVSAVSQIAILLRDGNF